MIKTLEEDPSEKTVAEITSDYYTVHHFHQHRFLGFTAVMVDEGVAIIPFDTVHDNNLYYCLKKASLIEHPSQINSYMEMLDNEVLFLFRTKRALYNQLLERSCSSQKIPQKRDLPPIQLTVDTPDGTITAGIEDGEYPGIRVKIDGQTAVVVEHDRFVRKNIYIRVYTQKNTSDPITCEWLDKSNQVFLRAIDADNHGAGCECGACDANGKSYGVGIYLVDSPDKADERIYGANMEAAMINARERCVEEGYEIIEQSGVSQ